MAMTERSEKCSPSESMQKKNGSLLGLSLSYVKATVIRSIAFRISVSEAA